MATLFIGLKKFIDDMTTLQVPTQIWASLFPFPQILVGGYLTVTRGIASPAGWFFASRIASFFIAGQECVLVCVRLLLHGRLTFLRFTLAIDR
jgi:hypothetical protein